MSAFLPGFLIGYILGIASMCGLVGLCLLHRPKYVAPTMHNRKWRDAPVAEVEKPAEPMYMYGVTGLEE
ncbi:hypothetical protein [Paraburkholderia dilworthii]|uniref:hypothetical protein n=1 Tax=Paraburkholderia dilworthii TaxID=948106 RepID=UPI0004022115|nr:hypothetical protein [Paraburkholderia dilworthii]